MTGSLVMSSPSFKQATVTGAIPVGMSADDYRVDEILMTEKVTIGTSVVLVKNDCESLQTTNDILSQPSQ